MPPNDLSGLHGIVLHQQAGSTTACAAEAGSGIFLVDALSTLTDW